MKYILYFFLVVFSLIGIDANSQSEFVSVTNDQNINAVLASNSFGAGTTMYDFNQDGWDDLCIPLIGQPTQFYLNNQGTLELQSFSVTENNLIKAFQWVDYDNDHDLDLFYTVRYDNLKLYRNDGNFNFVDVSSTCGLFQNEEATYGASWGDYDKDGDLDVFICNYEFTGDDDDPEKNNHFYINNGDGTFTDNTQAAGLMDGVNMSFQSLWFDYDLDGWDDLYIINDKIWANKLYKNLGTGVFEDVSEASGADVLVDAMTASCADFDENGYLDLYITNTPGGNVLLRNNGDGTFTDIAEIQGVLFADRYNWGGNWIDIENDSDLDLYVAEWEALEPEQENILRINGGSLLNYYLEDGNEFLPAGHNADSYSVSSGDINNDGYIDLAIHNRNPFNYYLYQNTGGDNNYIKISLEGVTSNYMGIGSIIEVYAGGKHFIRQTFCGENYLGQDSQREIFGLSQWDVVDSINVTWPSGYVDHLYDLDVNQTIHIQEGSSFVANIEANGPTTTCYETPVTLTASGGTSYLWNTDETTASITVTESGSYFAQVFDSFGNMLTTETIEVTIHPTLDLNVFSNDVTCFGLENGGYQVIINGQLSVVEVLLNGFSAEFSQSDLGTGNYQIYLVDENGCDYEDFFSISEPDSLQLNLSTIDVLCNGDATGSIFTDVIGGTGPTTLYPEELDLEQLPAGNYTIEVIDSLGCSTIDSVTISEPEPLTFTLDITDANDGENGIGEVTISGGQDPYVVEWSNGEEGELVTNLGQGTFTVEVFDANGCSETMEFDIVDSNTDEITVDQLILFPNPADDIITISYPKELDIDRFVMIDSQGKTVKIFFSDRSGQETFSIDYLTSNTEYFINAITKDFSSVLTLSFIKK